MLTKKNESNFEYVYNNYLVYSSNRYKKQGFETTSRNFRLHILPFFKDKDVMKLTVTDIMDWQTFILSKKFSNSFNNSLYYGFSNFIKYCIKCGYLKENLVLLVGKFPKKNESKKHNVYTLWEFRKFRRHIKDKIIKQYFNFMFFVGTRPSEAMALKFEDFDGLWVSISHSLHRRGKRELDTPKNQSSIRDIKISILMWIRIYKLKKYYIKEYGTFERNYFVFGGLKPLSTSTVDRKKKEACKKANLHEITQHEFRHSFATRKIHKGENIDKVSREMGHSKTSTTVDIYLHQEKRMYKHSFFKLNF